MPTVNPSSSSQLLSCYPFMYSSLFVSFSLSFYHLGILCLVGFLLCFFARNNIRPRPEYSAGCLVCPLLFG